MTYKILKIHGYNQIIKMIDGKPHIPDKKDKRFIWVETIIDPKRMKKFKEINDAEIIEKFLK